MKVGITIGFNKAAKDQPYDVFINGLRQHMFFFYDTLKNIDIVDEVYIVNVGEISYKEQQFPLDFKYNLADFEEVKNKLDVLFELGMEVSRERVQYLKGRGCKFIGYGAGNSYVIGIEKMMFDKKKGDLAVRTELFDEFWTNEQHLNTNKYYWEGLLKTEVKSFPHIWSPKFIKDKGEKFKKFKEDKPKISILEPNINVVKTFVYPLLICERLNDKNSDLIKHVFVTNSYKFKENPQFRRIFKSTNLYNQKKLTAEGRFRTIDYMNKYGDIVVTHQWENALNYIYYELLYLNYPLIHNSQFLKNVGYYYPGFNTEVGAKQLKKSITKHFDNKKEYDKNCNKFIKSISPDNPEVIEKYKQGLLNLFK